MTEYEYRRDEYDEKYDGLNDSNMTTNPKRVVLWSTDSISTSTIYPTPSPSPSPSLIPYVSSDTTSSFLSNPTLGLSSALTSVSSTVTLKPTTLTAASASWLPISSGSPALFASLGSGVGTSGSSSNRTTLLSSQLACVGHAVDNQAIGTLGSLILSSFIGALLLLLFSYIRPRFRQLYALREWFIEPELRPRPLSDRPWAFLFPHVPFMPQIPQKLDNEQSESARELSRALPSDQELMQRVLWIAFLICLGWAFLGLAAGLPLYLINTPCVAQSSTRIRFGGQLSTLQDLTLLRLLTLLDDRNKTVTSPSQLIFRQIINGNDFAPNARTRLIVLTVFVIVLGVLPVVWKLYKEFNKLMRHREYWLTVKCANLDLAWLNSKSVPGFQGWGEQRLREFLHKNGLGHSLIGGASRVKPEEYHKIGQPVEITGVFTIVDTSNLKRLISERTQILNRLEEAETQYIASFRLTTPDPSIAEELPTVPDAKPYISRPRVLAGTLKTIQQRRKRGADDISTAPSSFVAPSPYYRLREPRHHRNGFDTKTQSPFGQAVHERITGSRFQEVNRNSTLYDPIPLGSALQMGESGNLEPIPEDVGRRFTSGRNEDAQWHSDLPQGQVGDLLPPNRGVALQPPSDSESFPMRRPSQNRPPDPPHLRTQTDRPFVRPLSGIDHEGLSLIYDDIRHWRARLKSINSQVFEAQEDAYLNISEGTNIKGWLLVGRGLRFFPGVEMIEGRCKSDIRWEKLQGNEVGYQQLAFWTTISFIGMILGAGLIAVIGLALSEAPNVSHFLTFLQPLSVYGNIGASLAITLVPAILLYIFVVVALRFVNAAAEQINVVSVSNSQFIAFKATFYLLTFVAALWVTAVGSLLFAIEAFDSGTGRIETVAHGSFYIGNFILVVIIIAAIISPALLLLQPRRAWKMWRNERVAITPRQRFRALYPGCYSPATTLGCGSLAMVFAAMFSVIIPLIGPAIVLLLFLTLVAHRYLIGYVYGRTGIGERGGLLQIWLIRRFASIAGLQPLFLGLLLLSQRLWVLGGILTGVGSFLVIAAEAYAIARSQLPGRKSLSSETRRSLAMFRHVGRYTRDQEEEAKPPSNTEEQATFTSRERLSQARSRGSLASVLEMMSITLATMPSHSRNRLAVPLETEDLDDLAATERAARTHPSAPPHLPPLPFEDRAKETSGMLYPPEMLAEPPPVWLPNDQNGTALAEAYDLQRYHDLAVVLDLRKYEDAPVDRR